MTELSEQFKKLYNEPEPEPEPKIINKGTGAGVLGLIKMDYRLKRELLFVKVVNLN